MSASLLNGLFLIGCDNQSFGICRAPQKVRHSNIAASALIPVINVAQALCIDPNNAIVDTSGLIKLHWPIGLGRKCR